MRSEVSRCDAGREFEIRGCEFLLSHRRGLASFAPKARARPKAAQGEPGIEVIEKLDVRIDSTRHSRGAPDTFRTCDLRRTGDLLRLQIPRCRSSWDQLSSLHG